MRKLPIEIDEGRYLADPDQPVDRWFQAANGSNSYTVASIMAALTEDHKAVIVDPFAGAGSTATAARLRSSAYYGIERDPLLACASLAKSQARLRHLALLPDLADAGEAGWLREVLDGIRTHVRPADGPIVSALAVVAALRSFRNEPIGLELFRSDLATLSDEATPGRLICGDSMGADTWRLLDLPAGDAIVYTSPPFGPSSWTLDAPAEIREGAATIFEEAGLLAPGPAAFASNYLESSLAVIQRLVEHIRDGWVVLEHEPDDEGGDSTGDLIDRLHSTLGPRVRDAAVDRYPAFSARGPFSLLSFRVESSRSRRTSLSEILVTGTSIPPEVHEMIEKRGFRSRAIADDELSDADLHRALRGARGYLIGGYEEPTAEHFERAQALEAVAFIGTDFRGHVPGWQRAFDLGIAVANTPGANAVAVAEFVIHLVLMLYRPLLSGRVGRELRGRTLGIVGMGRIGAHVTRIATLGLGMRVLYYGPRRNEVAEAAFGARYASLPTLLADSDVVSLHRPAPAAGEAPPFGYAELSRMRSHAVLINSVHAALVDADALARVMEEKAILAAFDGIGAGPEWEQLVSLGSDRFLGPQTTGFRTYEAALRAGELAATSVCDVLTGADSPLVNNPDFRERRKQR